MKYEDLECEAFLIEKAILEESDYNWKKHFIHLLPEMIYFLGKWFVVFSIAQMFLMSMAYAVADAFIKANSVI